MAKKKTNSGVDCAFSVEDFEKHNDRYEKKNIADETVRYCIINAINRNIARQIPSGFDGLKPVARRTLLVLHEDISKGFQKVNTVAGNVMNKYHPHGDTSIQDVIGKMGQGWNNNVLYIVPDGNFGNLQGDEPAAGRYIKCKISKFAEKCFFEDYKYASVDKKPTYNGEGMEPEYLPARYPVALINPQFSSIGWGTAANIAPYNFTEVMQATIALLKDNDAKIKLIPDFPNGCEIVADKKLAEVNKNGKGSVTVRSSIEIDHENNVIIIKSTPYKVGTKDITSALANLVVAKKIEGIKDIKDSTSARVGVHIEISLQKDVNPEKMVETLVKKGVGLQSTFGVQIKFIEDYAEYDFSPKAYLLNWIDFRREVKQSMYNRKYGELQRDYHLNEVKLFIFNKDNLNKTFKIVRKSSSVEDGIQALMKEYKEAINMTTLQAKTIMGMRVQEFNKSAYESYQQDKIRLEKEIAETEKIISDPTRIDKVIEEELEEGIKLFGSPRKSKVIYDDKKSKKVDDTKMLVAISKDGFIKKLNATKYYSVGNLGQTASKETLAAIVPNNNSIIAFDSKGVACKIAVSGLPEMTPEDPGVEISRYFKVTGEVVSMISDTDVKTDSDVSIIFTTAKGFSKRTSLKDILKIRDTKVVILIDPNDQLISTILDVNSTGTASEDVIIFTTNGNGVRLATTDIPRSGIATKGKSVIGLAQDEYVAGIDHMNRTKKLLFYITSAGRAKVTEEKYFPRMNKKDPAIKLVPLTATEQLVAVLSVSKSDTVRIYKKNGEPEDFKISDIKPSLRVAKPEKITKVPKSDIVLTAKLISKSK